MYMNLIIRQSYIVFSTIGDIRLNFKNHTGIVFRFFKKSLGLVTSIFLEWIVHILGWGGI